MAKSLIDALIDDGEGQFQVGDNQPYAIDPKSDYSIPVHGEGRGLRHVMIEIRQDLLANDQGIEEWSLRLARCYRQLEPALVATAIHSKGAP